MSYLITVRNDGVLLREEKEPIADLYDACERAAKLATELTGRYSIGPGTKKPAESPAVEVISESGAVVFRAPIPLASRQ